MTWNGRYHPFHCADCYAFVRVLRVWVNGFDEIVRVEGHCHRHGEVVVEGWDYDNLFGPNDAMRIDTPAPATTQRPPAASSAPHATRSKGFGLRPALPFARHTAPPARPTQGARPALME
jgi:hypothetical protein